MEAVAAHFGQIATPEVPVVSARDAGRPANIAVLSRRQVLPRHALLPGGSCGCGRGADAGRGFTGLRGRHRPRPLEAVTGHAGGETRGKPSPKFLRAGKRPFVAP